MEKNKMGIKPIPGLITKMALPVIFSMLIQALYNVVDSIFVSRVSEEALTAVSLAFPMQLIVIAAFVGLSTGISSAISRKLGEKYQHSAVQVAENGLFVAALLFVIVAIGGYFFATPVFRGFSLWGMTYRGFTENQTIISYGISYVKIVMLFSFGSIFSQAGMSVFRGTGDMIKPTISQLLGAVLNIALDPILIFGWGFIPPMGVKGAAIATVAAQIVSMLYIWIALLGGKSIIKLKLKEFKLSLEAIRQILAVGIPSAIMQGLASVMLLFMNIILSRFGDSAIAVMGVYFKIQSMVFMPVFGLSIGTMPVVGYNFGAKNKGRIKKAIRFSATAAAVYMTICLVIVQALPAQLLGLFNASSEMLAIGIPAFRSISLIFPLIAITIILTTVFQAFGKAYYSLIVSIVRQLVVLIPVAFILASFSNIDLVWFAFIIAEIVGLVIVTILFSKVYKQSVANWEMAIE